MKTEIPEKVLGRLTLYHSILTEYIENGVDTISSPQIAARLNIDDSQVRKDFKLLNNAGRCRVGYSVSELKDSIEDTLGFKMSKTPLSSARAIWDWLWPNTALLTITD